MFVALPRNAQHGISLGLQRYPSLSPDLSNQMRCSTSICRSRQVCLCKHIMSCKCRIGQEVLPDKYTAHFSVAGDLPDIAPMSSVVCGNYVTSQVCGYARVSEREH